METRTPRYIAVEGPIGVGKTSLAVRLAEVFKAKPLLEVPEDNPFLERFYEHAGQAALSVQLSFLMQRARQLEALRQQDIFTSGHVADFMIEKDDLFAQLTLTQAELDLYRQVYSQLVIEPPVPDLVVYLQAPVEVLWHRIRRRGREFERTIKASYLERVNQAYAHFFYNYERSAVLIVNAADIDFKHNDQDFQALLSRVRDTRTGRHYFNPLPFAT